MFTHEKAANFAAIGLATTLALGGCAMRSSESPPSLAHQMHNLPQHLSGLTAHQIDTRAKLDQGADMNLILVEPANKQKFSGVFPPETAAVHRQLVKQDISITDDIKQRFEFLTAGRYHPNSIHIALAGKLAFGNCVGKSPKSVQKLHEFTKNQERPHDINVTVVNGVSCADSTDTFSIAGYDQANLGPVITADGLSTLGDTIVHEVGHDAGLSHAGEANCIDPVTINDCNVNPTNDPTSIMGYTGKYLEFSTPEMAQLGLLDGRSIISEPASGEYTLNVTSYDQPILMTFSSDTNKQVYVSLEYDENAQSDEYCDKFSNQVAQTVQPYHVRTLTHKGVRTKLICYQVNKRDLVKTVQVREQMHPTPQSHDWTLANIMRPSRSASRYVNKPVLGEVNPGVLYTDSNRTVVLEKLDQNSAIIKVTRP